MLEKLSTRQLEKRLVQLTMKKYKVLSLGEMKLILDEEYEIVKELEKRYEEQD